MQDIQDRRDAPRIDLNLSVIVGGRQGQFTGSNLSSNGLFIRCLDPYSFMILDTIVIKLKPPLEDESVTVKAEIMRITDEGIGVEFIDLAPHEDEIGQGWMNLYCQMIELPEKQKEEAGD